MNVFIGCSAKDNLKDVYYREAVKLADYLASNDCNLICGGSDGVMARLQEVFANKNKGVMIMEVECYRKDNYRYPISITMKGGFAREDGYYEYGDVLLVETLGSYDYRTTSREDIYLTEEECQKAIDKKQK